MPEFVRELAVRLGMSVDKGSFAAAETSIKGVKAQTESLGTQFAGLLGKAAAIVGIGAMAHQAKEAFIDFNSSVEQSTISLAATHKMFKGGTWAQGMQTASALFEHYQDVAKRSVGETKDFLEMHQSIAAAAYQAGAQLDDLKKITEGAVVAGQVLGEHSFVTAMDIKQALTKGVEVRDRFMNIMLASQKMTKEQFNAMGKAQRVETLKKLLTADTIKEAAKQLEGSFAGVTSTFRDTLKIALGKVGENFFRGAVERLKEVNDWIDKNQDSVKHLMGLAETGLTAVTNIGKALGPILSTAVQPLLASLELLQDAQDYGLYKAKEFSVRGMREAAAQGKGAYDLYMARKYYKTAEDPDKPSYKGAGAAPQVLANKIHKQYQEMDWAEKLGYDVGSWFGGKKNTILSPERQRRRDAWGQEFQGKWGRAPTQEEINAYHADETAMWKAGKITYTGAGYSAGPVMSTPEANYSTAQGTGKHVPLALNPEMALPGANLSTTQGQDVSAFDPSLYGTQWSAAPEAKVSGDVNIRVKVDVPNIEASVEKVIESKFREGSELMSVEGQ